MRFSFLLLGTLLQANPVWSQTNVFVQNNSDEEFTFHCLSYDQQLSNDFWDCDDGRTIRPGRRERVAQLNRDDGIKKGKTYHFREYLKLNGNDVVSLAQRLKGNMVGSTIWQSVQEDNFYSDSNVLRTGGPYGDFHVKYQSYRTIGVNDDIEYITVKKNQIELPSTKNDPDSINVVTYNTWFRPIANTCQRAHFIPSHLELYDVIIFNEVFQEECRKILLSGLKSFKYNTKTLDDRTGKDLLNGGVLIVSKFEITKEDQHVYRGGACGGDDCLSAKGVMYARINKDGKNYHVFGTHPQADAPKPIPIDGGNIVIPDKDQSHNREKQFQQMKNFITKMNIPSNEPVILGGDFNVERNNQDEYKKMLQILEATEPSVLRKNGIVSHDSHANEFLDSEKDVRDDLDYIFVSDKHQPSSGGFTQVHFVKNWDAFRPIPTDKEKWDLSDHFPVAAHLKFKKLGAQNGEDEL